MPRLRHLVDALDEDIRLASDGQALRRLVVIRLRQALGISQLALLEPDGQDRLVLTALASEGALPPPPQHYPMMGPYPALDRASASFRIDWSINGRLAAAILLRTLSPRLWDEEMRDVVRSVLERLWFALQRIDAEARLATLRLRQSQILRLTDHLARIKDPDAVAGAALDFLAPVIGAVQLGFIAEDPEPRLAAWRVHNPAGGPLDEADFASLVEWIHGIRIARFETRAMPDLWRSSAGPDHVTVVPASAGAQRCGLFVLLHSAPLTDCADLRALLEDGATRAADAILRARNARALAARAEAQHAAEERLLTLIENIPQLVWRAVDDGQWRWASRQWMEFTGLSAEQSMGHGWLAAVHPDDCAAARAAWRQAANTGAMLAMDGRIYDVAEKRYRWFQTRARAVRGPDGGIEWLGTSTDVDELVRLRDRQQVLVSELQHRTRNLLGVVRSIGRQLMTSSDSMECFRPRFEDRLGAIARVQGLLSRSDATEVTLEELIAMELGAVGQRNAQNAVLSGPKVALPARAVQILALALHELATNALKYGAFNARGGKLSVTWRTEQVEAVPRLFIEWIEVCPEGVGHEPDIERRGYGRELIEKALPYQLSAETSFYLTGHGVRCTILVPLV
ncbi:sensor histidine kinase [Arsenicitalea aurantiaca]|nr:HWE histidine kinase domain-containing protein [Arsenicitalea aurantiaca]